MDAIQLDIGANKVSLRAATSGIDQIIEADGAVIAVPGTLVNSLVPGLDRERKAFFGSVQYVAHHVMHFKVSRPTSPLPASLLLPTAMGFRRVSNAWVHDHDDEHVRIHLEIKGAFGAETEEWDDDRILDACWNEVTKALPPLNEVRMANRILLRNHIGLCRRHVGYTTALGKFRALAPLARAAFAGDYMANSTLGRSYRSGVSAADQVIATCNT
jgi:hypothetical protein